MQQHLQPSSSSQPPVGPQNWEATVRAYYRLVDSGDVPGLLALFADDAVYRRPGYVDMRGHADLARFYGGERVIRAGRHTLDTVVAHGLQVAVTGEFNGVLKDDRAVSLRFADFFVFERRQIVRRDTYFFVPMV